MTQRGFIATGWLYLLGAVAVLALLSGIAYKIRESGKESVRLEWALANQKEKERQGREAAIRNTVTDKQEAAHATALASLDVRYRAALRGVRVPAVNNQAPPLSQVAASLGCPDRQSDTAERLAVLEEGVLGLLERGDKAIARTIVCKQWIEEQQKVVVE